MGTLTGRGTIRVLPADEAPRAAAIERGDGPDPLAWAAHRRFTASGRAALSAILESLALSPEDEVLITNSSGQRYVSPCVTCLVFNHCRPSRVLTDSTRAIIVIHEYGYPDPRLHELVALARSREIPLIEDCAHSFDSCLADGTPLGSLGDYAIFSLSKVIPVSSGGILVSAEPLPRDVISGLAGDGAQADADYRHHLPLLPEITRRRRQNYDAVVAAFGELPRLLDAGPGVTPWYVGLLSPDAPAVRDLLLVTTNPYVSPEAIVDALAGALASEEG
jgi:hypothetical protein